MLIKCLTQMITGTTGRFYKTMFLLAGFLFAPAVSASEGSMGQRLHAEHCMKCHDSFVYTRDNRIVNSYRELKDRIRQCELSNELAWFDEEIEAVSTYLNNNFYHFERD